MDEDGCSPFYTACCNGDVKTVKRYLAIMKAHEITRLEPNGNTALHAAASHDRPEVLKLLIGRCCSRSVRNSSNKTAFDEATTPITRALLRRPMETKRFEPKLMGVEWISDNFDAIWKNLLNPGRLFECPEVDEKEIKARRDCVIEWLEKSITNGDHKDVIMNLIKKSFETNSAVPLLQAYTEEGQFYSFLNKELAKVSIDDDIVQPELHPALIIARTFFRCAYYGRYTKNSSDLLYRAVRYDEKEIQKYKDHVGKGPFKTKTLWSTSKSREQASRVVCDHNVMLILKSRDGNCRRTLELSSFSAFPEEQEVLMVPLTFMQVMEVEPNGSGKYDIHLLYCDW